MLKKIRIFSIVFLLGLTVITNAQDNYLCPEVDCRNPKLIDNICKPTYKIDKKTGREYVECSQHPCETDKNFSKIGKNCERTISGCTKQTGKYVCQDTKVICAAPDPVCPDCFYSEHYNDIKNKKSCDNPKKLEDDKNNKCSYPKGTWKCINGEAVCDAPAPSCPACYNHSDFTKIGQSCSVTNCGLKNTGKYECIEGEVVCNATTPVCPACYYSDHYKDITDKKSCDNPKTVKDDPTGKECTYGKGTRKCIDGEAICDAPDPVCPECLGADLYDQIGKECTVENICGDKNYGKYECIEGKVICNAPEGTKCIMPCDKVNIDVLGDDGETSGILTYSEDYDDDLKQMFVNADETTSNKIGYACVRTKTESFEYSNEDDKNDHDYLNTGMFNSSDKNDYITTPVYQSRMYTEYVCRVVPRTEVVTINVDISLVGGQIQRDVRTQLVTRHVQECNFETKWESVIVGYRYFYSDRIHATITETINDGWVSDKAVSQKNRIDAIKAYKEGNYCYICGSIRIAGN